MLTLIGDFGGIAEVLHVFIGIFMAGISSVQLNSLLANRFYTWSRPELYRDKVLPIVIITQGPIHICREFV